MILGLRFNRLFRVAILTAVVAIVHGSWQGSASANPIAITTPTGLQGGDQFRFIFVTPTSVTTNATSTDINVYNNLVNTYASGFSYNGMTLTANAIVSVYGGVNAITNVGVDNVAVYSVSSKVASSDDNSTGLFSANTLNSQPVQDLSGASYTTGYVWTGSSGIGTEYYTIVDGIGNVYWGLGGPSSNGVIDGGVDYTDHVEVGNLASTTGYAWLSYGYGTGLQPKTESFQVYGLSQVFTVVPEPSSFLISGLGIIMVGLVQRSRKRN
jgi:hypothetical protein